MGVGGDTSTGPKKSFSNDTFKIEICGPEQEHLSVIDVPGIFKRTTAGLTTREDINRVKDMVISYMDNPRAVILAVIPANVDIATQEILELAEDCDPQGKRTLGVLTKPDLVDQGAEKNVISILDGEQHVLKLGWYVVRNPGQKEMANPNFERLACERKFFDSTEPWSKVSKERVGVQSLKARLVGILGEMIRREFLQVKRELKKKLRTMESELEALGPPRETKTDQHNFLMGLANRFQKILQMALSTHYAQDDSFDRYESLKLATHFVNRNETFSVSTRVMKAFWDCFETSPVARNCD